MTTASYYESNIYHRVESRENLSLMSYFREEKALVVSVRSKIRKAMSIQGWAVVPRQCRDGRSSPANPEVGTATQSRGIVETGEKFCETNGIGEKIRWTVPTWFSRGTNGTETKNRSTVPSRLLPIPVSSHLKILHYSRKIK